MPAHTHHRHGPRRHDHPASGGRQLRYALTLTLGFAAIEVVGGLWSGSLALLSDAGHMVTDALALGLAAVAAWLATRPPSKRHSYGLGRAEVIAALLNALFMFAVIAAISVEAWDRLHTPTPVKAGGLMAVAGAGLLINLVVAWTLTRGERTLNTRAALLHVMGDLLGSVAALASGVVIYLTGWTPIDPLLAILVCLLLLYSTLHMIAESLHVVMEGVPHHIDLAVVARDVLSLPHVTSVHDLHIWVLSSGKVALSAHVVLDDLTQWQSTLAQLNRLLHDSHGIEHTTLQPETPHTAHLLHRMGWRRPNETE
ncbi:MAG: cation diffusion facilitator family transporter [Gammaproteobacteria bacterium]|nr:cation diffusion facilitator family transporter [Gammaproteobacteria bacterium]